MTIIVTDNPEYKGPWGTEHALCDHCAHEWIAVHPCAEYLQCPICKKLSPSIVDLASHQESKE